MKSHLESKENRSSNSTLAANHSTSLGSAPQVFHDHGDALPAAYARRGQSVACLAASKFVKQRYHQARAGGAQRMPKRNRSSVDINLVAIEAKLFLDC